jgi:hypothetical protein
MAASASASWQLARRAPCPRWGAGQWRRGKITPEVPSSQSVSSTIERRRGATTARIGGAHCPRSRWVLHDVDRVGSACATRAVATTPLPRRYLVAHTDHQVTAHRGATAAVRRFGVIQEQPTEGVRPNARENGQIRPSTKRSGYRGAGSGQHLASVLQEGRENANIDAGFGFIWRISV